MKIYSKGNLLVGNLGNAGSFFLRFLGWFNPMFISKSGVLIHPCNAVHTIGMRRSIDVVFVDEARIVRRVVIGLSPWRWSICRHARYALELPFGMAVQYGFYEGQVVEFVDG